MGSLLGGGRDEVGVVVLPVISTVADDVSFEGSYREFVLEEPGKQTLRVGDLDQRVAVRESIVDRRTPLQSRRFRPERACVAAVLSQLKIYISAS
jgi:hypothetical protein